MVAYSRRSLSNRKEIRNDEVVTAENERGGLGRIALYDLI